MHTQAIEDYLKTVYEIQTRQDEVTTTGLAERLGVTPASVTGMVKKLAEMNLVVYERYRNVVLTEAGVKLALEVLRHHRLVELYLAQALGVPWDQVHAEAEKWEHVLSEDLEDRMDALLGYPTSDPHGSPIPSRDGTLPWVAQDRLSDMAAGQTATISEIIDEDPALLRYAGGLGLYPQVRVTIIETAPFDGPVTVRVGDTDRMVGRAAASRIYVSDIREDR
ncbi:MAG: metal-dependent transcriptional regulator [Armatimonadetes bacterium]|nr:metal-dependent transcriptional regulator [Armatimonadota bacterium]